MKRLHAVRGPFQNPTSNDAGSSSSSSSSGKANKKSKSSPSGMVGGAEFAPFGDEEEVLSHTMLLAPQ